MHLIEVSVMVSYSREAFNFSLLTIDVVGSWGIIP